MNKIELARFFDSDSSKIRTVTISDYEKMIAKQDKDALAQFVYNRLSSRYTIPHRYEGAEYAEQYKNGFSMMASYCLLIETIQSFKTDGLPLKAPTSMHSKRFFLIPQISQN
jgi:hypothetical protein